MKHLHVPGVALAAILLLAGSAFAGTITINEVRIDQPSTDNDEYFELVGAASASLNGLTYLVIGDGGGGDGTIEAVVDLTGSSIPADGIFLAGEASMAIAMPDLTTTLNFENGDNVTHLLVTGFTGSNGDDLDTNDDCVLDSTPWTTVVDGLALIEEANPPSGTECHYGNLGVAIVGPDGSFVPGHVGRDPDGSGPWIIGAFATDDGTDSPGDSNVGVIPVELLSFSID
ncbi:MAG: hypothetical protein AAGN66_23295 [Acidobacteriota bacterium]